MNNTIKLTDDIAQLEAYLKAQDWMADSDSIKNVEVPGDGNMNFTLRVVLNEERFIIKQSRDYVEKYPQVEAPSNRVIQEALFYKAVEGNDVIAGQMPELLAVDRANNVLKLEDLGDAEDFTYLYKENSQLSTNQLEQLISFAATLHNSINISNGHTAIDNLEMRRLNHEHIFIYPYLNDNGLDLDSICHGLDALATDYKKDTALKDVLKPLGEQYLLTGNCLLHGDFFPGSWLKMQDDIKIIDAEFCYFGNPAFEIGVLLAHLHLANQGDHKISKALKLYQDSADLDLSLTKKFMAVEILRRILGIAQLPLSIDLEKRKQLLTMSRQVLVS